MTNTLRAAVEQLAANFATSIVAAIRGSSLEDILGHVDGATPTTMPSTPSRVRAPRRATSPAAKSTPEARKAPAVMPAPAAKTAPTGKAAPKDKGPLRRRSPEEIAKALERVVALVKEKGGLRSEQIQKQLGMDKREMPRVLTTGVEKKRLKSTGEKRSRTYSAA